MKPIPPGTRIKELWAYLAIDPKDDVEGLTAWRSPNGEWMPLVGADQDRMKSLRTKAEDIARQSGHTIRLVRFKQMEVLEIINRQ